MHYVRHTQNTQVSLQIVNNREPATKASETLGQILDWVGGVITGRDATSYSNSFPRHVLLWMIVSCRVASFQISLLTRVVSYIINRFIFIMQLKTCFTQYLGLFRFHISIWFHIDAIQKWHPQRFYNEWLTWWYTF